MDVPTYIRYGFQNTGLASIAEHVVVYVYFDDILVSVQAGDGLLAEESTGSSEWDGLLQTTRVTPGVHTLRLEIDATDSVVESNERNNTIEKEFTWGTGSVEPKPAVDPTPSPAALAPLEPAKPHAWLAAGLGRSHQHLQPARRLPGQPADPRTRPPTWTLSSTTSAP